MLVLTKMTHRCQNQSVIGASWYQISNNLPISSTTDMHGLVTILAPLFLFEFIKIGLNLIIYGQVLHMTFKNSTYGPFKSWEVIYEMGRFSLSSE